MTERERLIRLIKSSGVFGRCGCHYNDGDRFCQDLADYLLENGVTVLPCNVSDAVYWIDDECISEGFITTILMASDEVSYTALAYYGEEIEFEDLEIGKTVFLTKDEAEKALKARGKEMGYLNELLSRNPLVIDGDTIRPHHKYTDDLYTGGVKISMNENIKQTNYDCINPELLKGRGE